MSRFNVQFCTLHKSWQKCFKKLILCASTNFYFYVTVCTQCSICSMFYVHWIWSRYILGSSKSPPFWRKSQECEKPTSFLRTIQSINCSSLSLLFSNKSAAIDNGNDNKWRHSYWIDTWLNSSADVWGYYIIGFHRFFSPNNKYIYP